MNLKEIRKAQGLSQAELAQRMNVNQTAISQWERGVYLPRLEKGIRLSEILHCSLSDLFESKHVSTMDT